MASIQSVEPVRPAYQVREINENRDAERRQDGRIQKDDAKKAQTREEESKADRRKAAAAQTDTNKDDRKADLKKTELGKVDLKKADEVSKEKKPAAVTESEGRRAERPEVLENLASVSEDGDTVQVSPEGNDKLEMDRFGKVTVKEQREKEEQASRERTEERRETQRKVSEKKEARAKAKARKETLEKVMEKNDANERTAEQVSTIGRTETEIKQMYQEGKISKREYDRAIEVREERREDASSLQERSAQDAAVVSQAKDQAQRAEIEMRELFSSDSSDAIDPAKRAELLSVLEDFALNP